VTPPDPARLSFLGTVLQPRSRAFTSRDSDRRGLKEFGPDYSSGFGIKFFISFLNVAFPHRASPTKAGLANWRKPSHILEQYVAVRTDSGYTAREPGHGLSSLPF
jgi:hypothetical protein